MIKQIQVDYPPNIETIKKHFDVMSKDIVFTYGDTLYSPAGGDINKPLMAHENTHSRQQEEMGVSEWWDKYIEDKNFRIEQEVEAYKNQYVEYCKNKKNMAKRVMFLNDLAQDLSSSIYGNVVGFDEAIKLIKHGV